MRLDEALFGEKPRRLGEAVMLYRGGKPIREAYGTELELMGLHSLQRRWDDLAERWSWLRRQVSELVGHEVSLEDLRLGGHRQAEGDPDMPVPSDSASHGGKV